MGNMARNLICKKCNQIIDQMTIEFFKNSRMNKSGTLPRVCGACLVEAIDILGKECEEHLQRLDND